MCVWLSLAVDRGMGDTNKYSTLLVDATLSILLRPGPCYRIVHQRKCSAAQCSAAQSRVHSTEYHEGASSSDKCDGPPPPQYSRLDGGKRCGWVDMLLVAPCVCSSTQRRHPRFANLSPLHMQQVARYQNMRRSGHSTSDQGTILTESLVVSTVEIRRVFRSSSEDPP